MVKGKLEGSKHLHALVAEGTVIRLKNSKGFPEGTLVDLKVERAKLVCRAYGCDLAINQPTKKTLAKFA